MTTYKIVMIRHGESEWNKENKFCGWFDANLSPKGVEEATAGGKALAEAGYKFDVAHTSLLTRAQVTLDTVLGEIGQQERASAPPASGPGSVQQPRDPCRDRSLHTIAPK